MNTELISLPNGGERSLKQSDRIQRLVADFLADGVVGLFVGDPVHRLEGAVQRQCNHRRSGAA